MAASGVAVAPEAERELDGLRERLVDQYAGAHERDAVAGRVDAICARFSGARVRSYLPILVERALRAELRTA